MGGSGGFQGGDHCLKRNAVLDHARLLAAFGIVLFHTGAPGATLGYAALPFFLMLLILLMTPGVHRMGFTAFARSRATRLLTPWAIWSAVYGILKLLDALLSGGTLAEEFPPYIWLTGTAVHLWFLPFAFASCLILYPIVRLRPDLLQFAGIVMTTTVLVLLLLGLHQSQLLAIPFAQWTYGGAAALIGLTFALAGGRGIRLTLALGGLGVVLGVATALGWKYGTLQLGLSGAALMGAIVWYRPETPLSRWAARISLGVYLVHPLIAAVLAHLGFLPPRSLIFAACTIIGSAAVAGLLDTISQRRKPA